MKNRLRDKFWYDLTWVVLASAGLALALSYRCWALAGVAAFLLAWHGVWLCKLYVAGREKLRLMVDAVDNEDYAFRFPTQRGDLYAKAINAALNRILQILSAAKLSARQREIFYEHVLQSVKTGVLVLDANERVVQSNREAARLLGLERPRQLADLSKADENLAKVIRGLTPGSKQTVSFQNERGKVELSIRLSVVDMPQGALRILALNDIESELDEREIDAWIRLTRVLTHEIMNSVTPIVSLGNTLLDRCPESETGMRQGLETICTTGKGLISFVSSYRKFTHLPVPEPALFYVKGFLMRMMELARHQDLNPSTRMELNVDPEDLLLHADERLVSQVVVNLLKNAQQAIGTERQDGLVSLSAYVDEQEAVVIEVSNNGPVIPADLAEEIFMPFFTTKREGTGIGLAVSRQLMRLSGGSITLRSEPGRTTFTLRFM